MDKQLVKFAFQLGYRHGLQKSAGPISDVALSLIPGAIPYVGPYSSLVGGATGQMSNPATDKDLDEYDEHPLRAMAPGVGRHRIERRLKKSLTDSSGNARHYLSQIIGGGTSMIPGAGLGALIGALASKDNRVLGAGVGAAAGAVTPPLIAALTALIRERRNKDKHKKYIESSTVPEYFVPGLAFYNRLKTIGHEQGNFKERQQKKQEALAALAAAQKSEGETEDK